MAVLVAATVLAGCTIRWGGPPSAPQLPGRAGTVVRVADGDTVRVHPVDGVGPDLTVRVLGIDAPEARHGDVPAECWADESTEFARVLLFGQPVSLVGDPTQAEVDRYGRTLAYLLLADGRNFSVLAASAGAARTYVYDRPVREHSSILWAEAEARGARRGMWGACPA